MNSRCAMSRVAPQMNLRSAALMFVAALLAGSCSGKSTVERARNANTPEVSTVETGEEERQPGEDQIGEDCVAFVRSTRVVPVQAASSECPACPVGGSEALSFRTIRIDSVACSGDTCNVVVTIRAAFNPASGQTIAGGLTGWIPAEQRMAYLSGQTPSGEQTYRLQITFKRSAEGWRAIEFDRAPGE